MSGEKKKKQLSLRFPSFFGRGGTVIRSSRPNRLGNLPHGFLTKKVVKLVEKGDDAIVAFELIVAFLEASHILYNMELLPAFAKINPVVA